MRTALIAVTCALVAGPASAQSFNLDLGDRLSPAGVPSAAYGAAAGQPGVWNAFGDLVSYGGSIVDLAGMPTGITLAPIPIGPFDVDFDNPLTLGDDQALLDDLADVDGETFVFSGLTNGFYRVYTYAFAPDDPTEITAVTPTGASTVNVGGVDWTGSHVEGQTFAMHCLEVTNGTVMVRGDAVTTFGSFNGFQFVKQAGPCPGDFVESCNGDGGDQMSCTPCPCGNNAVAGTVGGCLNSASRSARLIGSGVASVGADSLHFDMTGGTSNTFAVLTSGDNIAPNAPANPCFGMNSGIQAVTLDGLRCAVGNVQRHGARPTDVNGDVGLTTNGWGPPNGPAGGLLAQGGFPAGQTRHFQVIYREGQQLGCQRGQNTSQAVSVVVVP